MPCRTSLGRRNFLTVAGTITSLSLLGCLALPGQGVPRASAEEPAAPTTFQRRDTVPSSLHVLALAKIPEIDLQKLEQARVNMEALAQLRSVMRGRAAVKDKGEGAREVNVAAVVAADNEMRACVCELIGFASRSGEDAELSSEEARSLEQAAAALRALRVVSLPDRKGKMTEPEVKTLSQLDIALHKGSRAGVATSFASYERAFIQMLPAEGEESRLMLVEATEFMNPTGATQALVGRALFDPAPNVREQAVKALAKLPRDESRPSLLHGLRYPWAPAADHAAEALVALKDRDALPALKKLVDEPDPSAPFTSPGEEQKPKMVREVVRLNHLRNCVLCHANAQGAKGALVVAPVPEPGKQLPVAYYGSRRSEGGPLVRADITYLRQDFSVTLPVEKAAPWPDQQRFDFLVRTREATTEEIETAKKPTLTYPQREAVLWAIAELEKLPPAKAKQ